MRRVLTDKLHLGQIGARGIKSCRSRTAGAIYFRKSTLVVANDASVESRFLEWLSVIFPVHAEVQCEIGTGLPFVLEVRAHLALHLSEVLRGNFGRAPQCGVFSAFDTERLVDYAHRSCQIC